MHCVSPTGDILNSLTVLIKLVISEKRIRTDPKALYNITKIVKAQNGDLSRTFCGSKSYSAPEILLGQEYVPFKADVW